jgi:hypothetical protein
MSNWKKIGTYYDMTVEEKGNNRRLIDITGRVVTEFQLD